MPTEQERTQKRHVREKAVVEHVADLVAPAAPDQEHVVHSPTTAAGDAVEEQVRKEWDPRRNGGLPTF